MATIVRTLRYSVYDDASSLQVKHFNVVEEEKGSATANGNSQQTKEYRYANGTFTTKVILSDEDVLVDFVVIRFDQSCFAWCGLNGINPRLDSLAIGMLFNATKPVATTVIGETQLISTEDEASALRIAKRAGLIAVHFGSALGSDPDYGLRQFAEKQIVRYLKGDSTQLSEIV